MARLAEPADPATVTPLRPRRGRGGGPTSSPALFLGGLGVIQALVFGAAGLFGGYYDFTVWGALSALTLVALVAVLVVRPRPPGGPACLAAGGLVALSVLAALSLTWADSFDRAWTEVNRLVFYLATFLLAAVVLRRRTSVRTVAGVVGAAIGLCTLIILERLLSGETGAFLDHRLNDPVQYINGTACLMLMGIWPLVAFAERDRPPWLAGLAVALASAEASLLVLTEARAVIPALLGSGLILLGFVPGRLARFWTVAAVAVGAGLALPWTLRVYSHRDPSHLDGPSSAAIAHAAVATIIAAVVAGLLWAFARRVASRASTPGLRRAPRSAAICVLLAIPLAAVAVDHHPLRTVRTQWQAFTSLRIPPANAVRFTDVGGYRYDLWRVAIKEFEADPLRGAGAGSYGLRYFQLRNNPQSVRQPHSLELQMLAELGVAGLLALLVFIGGVGWAFARARVRDPALSVALGGMFLVWLLDTSVDWIYNLPGITALALIGAAGLCTCVSTKASAASGAEPLALVPATAPASPAALAQTPRRRMIAWTAVVIALVAAGAPSLLRQYLALERSDAAAASLATDPRSALTQTQAALRLDSSRPETYYTRSAAYARLGDYRDARATLQEVARIEPLNYVPWALLGDLATRRGATAQGAADYARARELDPRDGPLFGVPVASG